MRLRILLSIVCLVASPLAIQAQQEESHEKPVENVRYVTDHTLLEPGVTNPIRDGRPPVISALEPKKRPDGPVADRTFWILTGANVALAIADVELTQRCLHNGSCREGNPLMPTDRALAYGVKAAFVGGYSVLGYVLKRRGMRGEEDHIPWWYPQVGLAAGQGIVVGINIRVN